MLLGVGLELKSDLNRWVGLGRGNEGREGLKGRKEEARRRSAEGKTRRLGVGRKGKIGKREMGSGKR